MLQSTETRWKVYKNVIVFTQNVSRAVINIVFYFMHIDWNKTEIVSLSFIQCNLSLLKAVAYFIQAVKFECLLFPRVDVEQLMIYNNCGRNRKVSYSVLHVFSYYWSRKLICVKVIRNSTYDRYV